MAEINAGNRKRETCLVEGYYRPKCRHFNNEDAIVPVIKDNFFPEKCEFGCEVLIWYLAKEKEF